MFALAKCSFSITKSISNLSLSAGKYLITAVSLYCFGVTLTLCRHIARQEKQRPSENYDDNDLLHSIKNLQPLPKNSCKICCVIRMLLPKNIKLRGYFEFGIGPPIGEMPRNIVQCIKQISGCFTFA